VVPAAIPFGVAIGIAVGMLGGGGSVLAVPVLGNAVAATAFLGARLSARVPQHTPGRAFAGLVVAVAGYLLVSAAFLGGPPHHLLTTRRKGPDAQRQRRRA
jgi:uncharacterized membrane protein YfcA